MGASSSLCLPDIPPDEVFQVLFLTLPVVGKLVVVTLLPPQIRVANAGNSCYIDSVLFAMFAIPSSPMDALLSKRFPNSDMNAGNKQELQRVVSKQFVSRLRGMMSVSVDMIANIRAQCRRCGWEYVGAPDQQQDACEFFSFFFLALGGQVSLELGFSSIVIVTCRTRTTLMPSSLPVRGAC